MNDNDGTGDALAEAAQWHARLRTLPVSHATLADFFTWWRIESHAQAFTRVSDLHDRIGGLAADPDMLALAQDAYDRGLRQRRRRAIARPVAVATVVVLALGSWLGLRQIGGGDRYATHIGETRQIALADGSRVMLDTDSELSARFTNDARHIVLKRGQAYFTVAHNTARPFVVEAGSVHVTATGTQFDVRRSGDRITVMLVRGGVDVATDDGVSHLKPGQEMTIEAGQKSVPMPMAMTSAMAWTQGRIVLDNVPLGHAINEVNRYTRHPIRLDATRYAEERFSGSLITGDVPSFVALVTETLPLKAVTRGDGSVHLTE